jgi:hypothetical protein
LGEESYYGKRSKELHRRRRRQEMRKEMAVVREIVKVLARSPFNSGDNEGAHNGSLKLHLDFWINGQIYSKCKESLISPMSQ